MRMKSEFWVKSYLRARAGQNVMAVLSRRGDADAGAIFVLVDMMDGSCNLYGPAPAGLEVVSSERRWVRCISEEAVERTQALDYLRSQSDMDPDIWIVEVEDNSGRHFLDDQIVRD